MTVRVGLGRLRFPGHLGIKEEVVEKRKFVLLFLVLTCLLERDKRCYAWPKMHATINPINHKHQTHSQSLITAKQSL